MKGRGLRGVQVSGGVPKHHLRGKKEGRGGNLVSEQTSEDVQSRK